MKKKGTVKFFDSKNNLCELLKDPYIDGKGILRDPRLDMSFYDAKGILRTIVDGIVTFIDGRSVKRTVNINEIDTIEFYDNLGYLVLGNHPYDTYDLNELYYNLDYGLDYVL